MRWEGKTGDTDAYTRETRTVKDFFVLKRRDASNTGG
jgi:hypothetical protein